MRQFHRPAQMPAADLEYLGDRYDPNETIALAHDTAWALVQASAEKSQLAERIIAHAVETGVDDVAELWGSAHPHTLAGALWRLYLIRQAITERAELAALLYRAGSVASDTANAVIAGAAEPVTPESIEALIDTIFRGVFAGDLGDALDRAWAYARVIAEGASQEAESRADAGHETRELVRLGSRYLQIAADLAEVSKRWRSGMLD